MAVNPNPYQNTNAQALVRLRPLENNNIGAIVQEHIRYWQKKKDDDEAQKLARQAKEAEYKRKLNKDTFEFYKGIQPEDNVGYFNSQIIDAFEKRKPYFASLARRASEGDINAMLELEDTKRNIKSITEANKIYSEKTKALQEQKANGEFNPILDSDTERFAQSLSEGKYMISPDFKSISVYSPAKDEVVRLSTAELYDNDFLRSSYSKPADFDGQAKTIANDLLNTEDGQKLIDDPTTKRRGVSISRAVIDEDQKFARSWYGTAQQRGLIDFNTPYNQLSEIEKNKLAETYYDNVVYDKIQETRNPLGIAQKKQALTNAQLEAENKRLTNKKKGKDLKKDSVDLSIATTEDGQELKGYIEKNPRLKEDPFIGKYYQDEEIGTALNIVGTATQRDVKDDKETSVTYTHLIKDNRTGDIIAIGNETVKEKVPIYNEDGSPQIDSNGNQKFTTKATTEVRVIRDDKELNTLASQFDDVTNLKELSDKVNTVLGQENVKPKNPNVMSDEEYQQFLKDNGLN